MSISKRKKTNKSLSFYKNLQKTSKTTIKYQKKASQVGLEPTTLKLGL